MIRYLSIFFLVPLLSFGAVSNAVVSIVNRVDSHLESANVVLQLAKNDCRNCLDNLQAFAMENYGAVHTPAASNFYFAVTNCSTAIVNIDLALDQIGRARSQLNLIPTVSDGMVTNVIVSVTNVTIEVRTNCCESCNRKLDAILDLVTHDVEIDELTNYGVNQISNDMWDMKATMLNIRSDMDALLLGLSQISNQLDEVRYAAAGNHVMVTNWLADISGQIGDHMGGGGGGGGGGGCDCSQYLVQILSFLEDVYRLLTQTLYILQEWEMPLKTYLDFYNSLQDVISDYYSTLLRRYKDFDSRLPDALAKNYYSTLTNIDSVTTSFRLSEHSASHSLMEFLSDPDLSGVDSFQLSNEGVIGLYSAFTLDRSYLTQVAIYDAITNGVWGGSGSTNDWLWLQDYLLNTQRPFFQSFYDVLERKTSFGSINPFMPSETWSSVSNWFSGAHVSLPNFIRSAYYGNFRNSTTNWFDRIELYLMNLNGLLLPPDKTGQLEDQDKTAFEEDFSSISNSVMGEASVINYALSSVSNQLVEVFDQFKECLDALSSESSSGTGTITIFEGGTYFGVTIPTMSIDSSDLDSFVDPCRNLFSFLWLALLAVSSTWLLCRFIYVVTNVIVRITFFMSTFLSPS